MSDKIIIDELFESLDLFCYEELEDRDFFGGMDKPKSLNCKFRISSDRYDFYTGIFPNEIVDLIKTSEKKFVVTVSRVEMRDGEKNVAYRQRLQELINSKNTEEIGNIDDDDLYELTPNCVVRVLFSWEFPGGEKRLKTTVATGKWIRALSEAFTEYKKTFNLQRDFVDVLRGDGSVIQ